MFYKGYWTVDWYCLLIDLFKKKAVLLADKIKIMHKIYAFLFLCLLVISSCKPNMDKYKTQNDLYEKFVVRYLFHSIRNEKLWLPEIGKGYEQLAEKTDTLCNEFFEKSFLIQDFKTCKKDFITLHQNVTEILSNKWFFLPSQTDYFIKQTQIVEPLENYDDLFSAYLKVKSYAISTIRSGITSCDFSRKAIFEIDTCKEDTSITISAYTEDVRKQFPIDVDILSISQNGSDLSSRAKICRKPSLMSINLPLTNNNSPIQLITSYTDNYSDSLKIDTFIFSQKRYYHHKIFGWRINAQNPQ